MEYSKEFKTALSEFPAAEKDRLIFRLLKKDKILSQKLYFELIDPENQDDKRAKMEVLLTEEVDKAAKNLRNPKYFLVLIRKISAKITEHVKITTDKLGEVSLNLMLVTEILSKSEYFRDSYKLYIYLLNKIFKVLTLTQKLDEDYFLEIQDGFEKLHELILKNREFEKLALIHGLDLNWLSPRNIPAKIALIQKELKNQGFLK